MSCQRSVTSSYLRKPRIPDAVRCRDRGMRVKLCSRRGGARRCRSTLDAGPFEAEVGSFWLHLAAEGKAAADDPELHRGGALVRRRPPAPARRISAGGSR